MSGGVGSDLRVGDTVGRVDDGESLQVLGGWLEARGGVRGEGTGEVGASRGARVGECAAFPTGGKGYGSVSGKGTGA